MNGGSELYLRVQVLRLLEDVGLPELVIQLASLAITETVSDVSGQVRRNQPVWEPAAGVCHCIHLQSPRASFQAALWTRIFKHHLDLGHNSEAYEALTQNPDSSMYVHAN